MTTTHPDVITSAPSPSKPGLYIEQDGFAVYVPSRESIAACAYCPQPITQQNDYRLVTIGGRPAKSHRYCGPAYGEEPRG